MSDAKSEPQPGMVGRERRGGQHAASGAGRIPRAGNRRDSSPISPREVGLKGAGALEEPRRRKHRNLCGAQRDAGLERARGFLPVIKSDGCKPLTETYSFTTVSVTHPHTTDAD